MLLPWVAISILCGTLFYWWRYKRPPNFPPGPTRLPVLGSLLAVGPSPYLKFVQWKKSYGPVVGVDFGSFPTVAVSDWRLVKQCVNDPACQGRPDLQPFLDRSGGIRRGILFSDGEEWAEQRRFAHRILKDMGWGRKTTGDGRISLESIFTDEVRDWMENFKAEEGKPVYFQHRFYLPVLNGNWYFLAGERLPQDDPKVQKLLKQVALNLETYNGMADLLMFIPWFTRLFPSLSGYDKMMADLNPVLEFFQDRIDEHKKSMTPGSPRDFIDAYLDKIAETEDPWSSFYGKVGEISLKTVMLDFFFAGTESFCTTINWLLLYFAKYPQVQAKLLDEIDSVIGHSRSPSLTDRPSMVYLEAIINEITRITSIAAIGLFRRVTQKTQIAGFTIPKDTMLILNYYACNHDQEYWKDPEIFRPERWIDQVTGKLIKHEPYAAFGGGKRVCIGETFARDELFIYIANIFQKYKVEADPMEGELCTEPKVSFLLSSKSYRYVMSKRV